MTHAQRGPLDAPGDPLGWLLVPEDGEDGRVRVLPTTPGAAGVAVEARWRRAPDGYTVTARLPLVALQAPGDPTAPFGFDLLVNEIGAGRERRRGQLVLSGARGEFVYLQGDRHDPARFLRLRLAP